tara:strand:- start:2469 stop:3128 length:660 start_codon:yes stop_codon:yes gene_type:complete
MHETVKNLINIQSKVKQKVDEKSITHNPVIIAVSKTFDLNHITPLIDHGHVHYGENKVQEALEKWTEIKQKRNNLKLHLIGKLQTNKAKFAVKLFDYIHSLDNEKLAKKISSLQQEQNHKVKLFIQVNIGEENQKSGINENELEDFYRFCLELDLNIIGLMCIPPIDQKSEIYFNKMKSLKKKYKLNELSMGMSSDYLKAIDYESSYIRIGSSIFGERY